MSRRVLDGSFLMVLNRLQHTTIVIRVAYKVTIRGDVPRSIGRKLLANVFDRNVLQLPITLQRGLPFIHTNGPTKNLWQVLEERAFLRVKSLEMSGAM